MMNEKKYSVVKTVGIAAFVFAGSLLLQPVGKMLAEGGAYSFEFAKLLPGAVVAAAFAVFGCIYQNNRV